MIVTFWDTLFSLNLWNGIEYTLKLDTVDTMQDLHCVGHNVEYIPLWYGIQCGVFNCGDCNSLTGGGDTMWSWHYDVEYGEGYRSSPTLWLGLNVKYCNLILTIFFKSAMIHTFLDWQQFIRIFRKGIFLYFRLFLLLLNWVKLLDKWLFLKVNILLLEISYIGYLKKREFYAY